VIKPSNGPGGAKQWDLSSAVQPTGSH